jgi:serine/threonine protein kinase
MLRACWIAGSSTFMRRFYLPAGTDVGRYTVVRPIGAGGGGAVYEAVDGTLGRRVALKVRLVPDAEGAGGAPEVRFTREAQAAARVCHPNIVGTYDFGVDGDLAYLVMELVEGETLGQLLRREGALGVARTLEIMLPILAAVAELHAHGIVHRDIKPSNILLTRTGAPGPKLADFGVSRFIEEPSSITGAGVLLGTPGYMAPEATHSPHGATEATDQYALGIVLYECATGKKPLCGEMESSLADLFTSIVSRATQLRTDMRFPSVDALGDALVALAPEPAATRWRDELAPASLSSVDRASKSAATFLAYDGAAIALRGDVFTVVWKAPARMARIQWMFDVADRFASQSPDRFLALVIVLPSSSPPDYSTTMECIKRLRRLEPSVRRQSTVAVGRGIWMAVVRSVHRAMKLPVASRAGRLTMSGTIEEGIERIQDARTSMTPSTAELHADVLALYDELGVAAFENAVHAGP